jgi:hypothetical protein
MPDVDTLFEEFVARYHAGDAPDALEYIERAEERADELAAMIAAILEAAPAPPSTEATRTRALDVPAIATLAEGDFGAVLSDLRKKSRETRASLSRRLAEALGLADQTAKVKRYYADLENGLLPPSRLQRPVVEALADLLETSVSLLDIARASWRPRPPTTAAYAAFLRTETARDQPVRQPGGKPEPDEVDQLFLGGA